PAHPAVMVRKDQGIENGFGSARLEGFLRVAAMVAVIGSNRFPKPYTLRDVVQQSEFAVRVIVCSEWLAKRSPRESEGERRMTGNAKRLVIARRALPSHPPVCSSIDVSRTRSPIPGASNLSVRSRAGA